MSTDCEDFKQDYPIRPPVEEIQKMTTHVNQDRKIIFNTDTSNVLEYVYQDINNALNIKTPQLLI